MPYIILELELISKEAFIMAEENVQLNSECRTGVHSQHLCYIVSQGFHLSDEQEYKALVEDAGYKCNHCGRAAKSDANLCVPNRL
jgi:hypothetical protein